MDFDFGGEHTDRAKIPTQFGSLYEDKEGGGLQLKSDDTVKGAVEAIVGLNKALKAERDAHSKAKGKKTDLSVLSSYGSSVEEIAAGVQTAIEELEGKVKGGADAKVEVERVRKDLTAAHETVLKAKEEKLTSLLGQLKTVLIDGQIMAAIGGVAKDPELLSPFVRQKVTSIEEDGKIKVVVVDEQNGRRFSTTGGDLSIAELVTEMKADEKFGVLFQSEAPRGSDHRPGDGTRRIPRGDEKKPSLQKIADGFNNRDRVRGSPVPKGMK